MPSYSKEPRPCLKCGSIIAKPKITQKYCSRVCSPCPFNPKGSEGSSYKHGGKGTVFYKRFSMIKERCSSPSHKSYKEYGGRGILCLWGNFESFKKDMHDSYQEHCSVHGIKNTTLERIDVNGNYSKENCKWATWKEQSRNKRKNKMLFFNGKTQCISAWGEELGICRKVIEYRIKNKWPIDLALTTEISHKNKINDIIAKATPAKIGG